MPDCVSCKEKRSHADVPFIVHEADMARMERSNKRLWIAVILLIVLFVGSNIAWLLYESQFEEEVTTIQKVEQMTEGHGNNSFVGGDYYGTAKSNDQNEKAENAQNRG